MTEEEQQQEVAVWGEYLNLMKDCSLEKTNENMYYNSEWDYTREESELEPEDKVVRVQIASRRWDKAFGKHSL